MDLKQGGRYAAFPTPVIWGVCPGEHTSKIGLSPLPHTQVNSEGLDLRIRLDF